MRGRTTAGWLLGAALAGVLAACGGGGDAADSAAADTTAGES